MSAGHVHTKVTLALAGGYLAGTLFLSANPADLQYVAGALIGVVITPDCDVDAGFIVDKYIRNAFSRKSWGVWGIVAGYWAEKAWDALWYMYRRSLKHGGELSHFPVVSTLGRMAYLHLFVIVVPTIVWCIVYPEAHIGEELAWWGSRFPHYYRVFLALMSADFIHWLLDICTTEHKK